MTTDDIRLLFEYDRWANRRALQQASTLGWGKFRVMVAWRPFLQQWRRLSFVRSFGIASSDASG